MDAKKTAALAALAMSACVSAVASAAKPGRLEREFRYDAFYRGNTHAHSLRSDGDVPAEEVVTWYRNRGDDFTALTDHNRASVAGEFADLEEPDRFVVIPGEEVTYSSNPSRAAHVTMLCAQHTIPAKHVPLAKDALQSAVSAVLAQPGALPIVNHPNFQWGLSYDDLMAVPGYTVLEVANQHLYVDNAGDAAHPSVEKIWDRMLTAGRIVYGVASDDAHDFRQTEAEAGHKLRGPGKGWIQVAKAEAALESKALCGAIGKGAFYATTGVELSLIEAKGDTLTVQVAEDQGPTRVTFVGLEGKVLATTLDAKASYQVRAKDGYVRVRIRNWTGKEAWVQPLRVLAP